MSVNDPGEFVGAYLHRQQKRSKFNTVCPRCKRPFVGPDRIFDLTGPKGFRMLIHEGCVTVTEQQGQLTMAPRPPALAARSTPSPAWAFLFGILAVLLVVGALLFR